MEKHNEQINSGDKPANHKPTPRTERIVYRSKDGQVEVVISEGKWKYPKNPYQIVTLRLRPGFATRIQRLDDNSGGLDVLFSHVEIARFLASVNEVDGKAQYRWRDIPEKSEARKALWHQKNKARLDRQN